MKRRIPTIIGAVVLLGIATGAALSHDRWLPPARQWLASLKPERSSAHSHDQSGGHSHDPPSDAAGNGGHAHADTLQLTLAAQKNIGLRSQVVTRQNHTRTISVPAVTVQRPGRSQNDIVAPLAGVVTKIYRLQGEAVNPGEPLFEIRLTHEDVAVAQGEFLEALMELDIVSQELKRLQGIGEDVIPGRRIIEQKYKYEKANTALDALRQRLKLHHLTTAQIQEIQQTRRVLKYVIVEAPPYAELTDTEKNEHVENKYHVQAIHVNRGQSVGDGQLLSSLSDHGLLYVEGQAFEEDARRLIEAARSGERILVIPLSADSRKEDALELKVLYVADHVDRQSRALKFYLLLPNQPMIDDGSPLVQQTKFVAWKFRPGQRMEVHIPTDDTFEKQVVLPPEAVAIDGPNAYVFKQDGDHFDRVDVHVLYRDKHVVVVENDWKLVDRRVVLTGAYEMHIALKNQSGGGVDPHAGHSH